MNENYTYPAIIDTDEDGFINICFPDFPYAMTSVEEGSDYISEAQNYLTLLILDWEKEHELPAPGKEKDIHLEPGQRLVYINIWMPYHRTQVKEVYVKKTLTIPSWLDILAKNNNINFSATLVEALKEKLHVK